MVDDVYKLVLAWAMRLLVLGIITAAFVIVLYVIFQFWRGI